MAQFIGTGSTVTFGTSGFTADILSIDLGGVAREAVDSSHMGSLAWRDFLVGKLTDPGELTLEIGFDPATEPPWNEDPEVITITFPDKGALTTDSTWSATGFMSGFDFSAPVEDRMTGTMTVKFTSAITVVPRA